MTPLAPAKIGSNDSFDITSPESSYSHTGFQTCNLNVSIDVLISIVFTMAVADSDIFYSSKK